MGNFDVFGVFLFQTFHVDCDGFLSVFCVFALCGVGCMDVQMMYCIVYLF